MFEDKRDLYVHNLRYHTAAIRQATEALINGELDELPEQAFLNVGNIDQVQAKAASLAES